MTAPQHMHRLPKNPRTKSEAISTMQGTSVTRRDVPVTLAPMPKWREVEADD